MNPREREPDAAAASDAATAAAAAIRQCRAALAARGGTIIREASVGYVASGEAGTAAAGVADWRHYPEGEAYDPVTHVQYFFHRHAARPGRRPEPADEYGHFHLFLRGEGIPAGISPLLFADSAVAADAPPRHLPPPQSAPLKRGRREEVCHLVAIAVDRDGEPTGLFTTNRWVTGETWYRADDAIRLIDRVCFDHARQATLLDRWIAALVRLFAPDIAGLLRQRDKAILEWRWRWPRSNVFEDPRLEITSRCPVDLDARLAAVEADMPVPGTVLAPAWQRDPLPPSLADGWGR